MIHPTVGRVVWFYPCESDPLSRGAHFTDPMAAMVVRVWGERLVNLVVHDPDGNSHGRTSVALVQPGDEKPDGRNYCTWMPYQIGQAVRHGEAVASPAG